MPVKLPDVPGIAADMALIMGRKIDVLSPKLFDRIVSEIKPYVVGGNCLVKFLHDLDVSDKHWLLIPLMRVGWINGIVVEDEKGQITLGNTFPIPGDGTRNRVGT